MEIGPQLLEPAHHRVFADAARTRYDDDRGRRGGDRGFIREGHAEPFLNVADDRVGRVGDGAGHARSPELPPLFANPSPAPQVRGREEGGRDGGDA